MYCLYQDVFFSRRPDVMVKIIVICANCVVQIPFLKTMLLKTHYKYLLNIYLVVFYVIMIISKVRLICEIIYLLITIFEI